MGVDKHNKAFLPIVPMGEYHVLDEQGFIVNQCSSENIKGIWASATQDVISKYQFIHGKNLQSIYLRGSVPRGTMVESISDIDSMCFVKDQFDEQKVSSFEADCEKYFEKKYPSINGVEFDSNILDSALQSHHVRFLLKSQSLCVWGDDVTKKLDNVGISVQSMNTCLYLDKINTNFCQDVEGVDESGEVKELCSWVFKAALRSAFEIVMLREMRYTRELYLCWKSYSKYYPDDSNGMYQALNLAVNPTADVTLVRDLWALLYESLNSKIENNEHLLSN